MATFELTVPSFTRYVKESVPEKLAIGTYVKEPSGFSVKDAAEDGPVTGTTVNGFPSASKSFDRMPGAPTLSELSSLIR